MSGDKPTAIVYGQYKDGKLLEKQYDDNFDGKFEKIVKTPGLISAQKQAISSKKR